MTRLALATISSTCRVLPVPSLDLVFRRLASVHAGIEPERLDDERSRLSRDTEALFLQSFHAFDEVEDVFWGRQHVPILFASTQSTGLIDAVMGKAAPKCPPSGRAWWSSRKGWHGGVSLNG